MEDWTTESDRPRQLVEHTMTPTTPTPPLAGSRAAAAERARAVRAAHRSREG